MTARTDSPPVTQFREPFWAWPGWNHLRYFALLGLGQTLWFGLIFGGADYLTAVHEFRVRIHTDAELSLPLVPETIIVYMSIYVLFLMAPFVLRTRQQIGTLARTIAGVTAFGGVCFLLLPADLAFPPPRDVGPWPQLFHFADSLNLDYNLVPSLHVAFSVVCVAVFSSRARGVGVVVLWLWAAAISLSTLLTHQHHIIDVIVGFLLGLVAVRLLYNPRAQHLPSLSHRGTSSISPTSNSKRVCASP